MFKVLESSDSSESSCGSSRPALSGKTAHALNLRRSSSRQRLQES
jgi:hypothetical protein